MEPTKYDTKKQYTGNFTPEVRRVFKEIVEYEFENDQSTTDKQVVERLCEYYESHAKTNMNLKMELDKAQRSISSLEEKLQTVENEKETLQAENANLADAAQSSADNSDAEKQSLQAKIEELQQAHNEKSEELSDMIIENAKLQSIANENAAQLTKMTLASANPEQGKYLVEFGDVAREIMDLTLSRLRQKLNKPDLTANMILTDLFVKYSKTRNHFGSFPTMVSGEEIRMIMKKYE
ncbi:MAG: hypothetical protein LBM68_06945 [Bacteroidales bacterium]|jgi:DNA repair exonuclease SbcCD ATPase subunit|nr:hypothetical protein [Bacteroidales bacterium]